MANVKDEHLLAHEAHKHGDASMHHHHSHATSSRHAHGHHLLQVEDLCVSFSMYDPDETHFFRARKKDVSVISDLSISVHAGEIMAIVGASGSGKSLLADSVLGLYEPNAIVSGTIWFDGVRQDAASLAQLRGREIAFVPQSVANLDPLMKVGRQVRGVVRDGADVERRAERQRALFEHYGLAPEVEDMYPFELSAAWPAACSWRAPWSKARVLLWPMSRRLASIWIWRCAPSTIFAHSPMRVEACCLSRTTSSSHCACRPYRRIQRWNSHRGNRR